MRQCLSFHRILVTGVMINSVADDATNLARDGLRRLLDFFSEYRDSIVRQSLNRRGDADGSHRTPIIVKDWGCYTAPSQLVFLII